jgi:Ca2+-binding RTX toxin-like protein
MGKLTHLQTIEGNWLSALGQSTILRVTGSETEPEVSLYDVTNRHEDTLDLTRSVLRLSDIDTSTRSSASTNITLDGQAQALDTTTLSELADHNGDDMGYLGSVGFYGYKTLLHSYAIGAQDYLIATRPSDAGLSFYRLDANGTPRILQTVQDSASTDLSGITALASANISGTTFVLAASNDDNGLAVLRHDTNSNRLELTASYGFDDKLPVTGPTALETFMVAGQQMVVMGSHDTGSLTVFGLNASGQLSFLDQVNDTRDTRFDNVKALASYSQGDVHLLAAGGNDGGISLFQVLPGGRLLHRETLINTLDMGLDSIEQLEFVQTNGRVELLVLSIRDQALTRFALEDVGFSATGSDGGAGADMLSANASGGTLRGNAGDDVMFDGAGEDNFYGGAGSDTFVFTPDDTRDTLHDFDPNTDQIDLSAYGDVTSVQDLRLRDLAQGVRVFIGDEELRLISTTGGRLTASDLADVFLFASDHVVMPEAIAQRGTAENEVFFAGLHADTIEGGAGQDMLSFENAPAGAVVDLSNNANNTGQAAGYVLTDVEGVTGGAFNDRLTGDALGNTLTGLAGNDSILGGAGNDWLTPGVGHDTVDGGSGTDMVSFVDLTQGANINLTTGLAASGGHTDALRNVENITGTIYGDFIQGNGAANLLRGLGDYDWIVGSAGNDTIDGGNGRDMISYVYAGSGVTVDLGQGRGLAGQAAGDTYVSVERVTGSIYPDLFYGSDGQDDFRGLGGYDWFIASTGGRDRYEGGTGLDTVSYAYASAGVSASLQLGYGSRGDAVRDLYTDIERLSGSNHDDILFGDWDRNVLRGMWGEDALYGLGGVDRLYGGGSDDYLDGGGGWDVALFDEDRDAYTITTVGRITYVDRIASGGEGTDTLVNIEALQFGDGTVYL